MRSKLIGFLFGCGLVVAAAAPAFACNYFQAQATGAPPQQTAQAQTSSDSQ
jgi:hypothetical protein